MVAVALAVTIAVIPSTDIALPDEGVYLAQLDALSHGSWWQPARRVPAALGSGAILPQAARTGEVLPYARRPLAMVVLSVGYLLAGVRGAIAVSTIFLLLAAIMAGEIGRYLTTRARVPTLYITALGSPLTFAGLLVSGQAIAAAAVTTAAVALLRARRHRHFGWKALAFAAIVVAVMTRTEATVLGAVATLVFVICEIVRRARRHDPSALGWMGATIGVGTIAGYGANALWVSAIEGTTSTVSPMTIIRTIHRAPLRVAWITLMQPWSGDGTTVNTFLALSAASLIAGAVAWRLAPRRPLAAVGFLTLAAVCSGLEHTARPDLVTGLLAVCPILAVGLVLTDWRGRAHRRPEEPLLTAVLLITVGALCLVIYDDGGASQWGGRFFHMILPLTIPLAVAAVTRAMDDVALWPRRIVVGTITSICVLTTAIGVRAQATFREVHHDIRLEVTRRIVEHRDGSPQVLLISTGDEAGLARTFWRTGQPFQAVQSDTATTVELLDHLTGDRNTSAIVLTAGDPALIDLAGRETIARRRWRRVETRRIPGLSVKTFRYDTTAEQGR